MSTIEQEARTEAEKRLYDGEDQQISNADEADAFVAGYIAGASRPVTDEQVERVAAAMWGRWGRDGMFPHAPVHLRNAFRADARAALEAARALAHKETP